MHAGLELGNGAVFSEEMFALSLDAVFDQEKDPQAIRLFESAGHTPGQDHFIADVLVDLGIGRQDGFRHFGEIAMQKAEVAIGGHLIRQVRRSLQIQEHEDAVLAPRPMIPPGDVPE